jgi:hypothetical protein
MTVFKGCVAMTSCTVKTGRPRIIANANSFEQMLVLAVVVGARKGHYRIGIHRAVLCGLAARSETQLRGLQHCENCDSPTGGHCLQRHRLASMVKMATPSKSASS